MNLGGVISALDALGSAPRAAWAEEPRAGNGFDTHAADDLLLLAELGITTVRLGFDWARLQPTPGAVDHDWREWYEHVLLAAADAGIEIWATLHERTVPAWFDDEGSFADARATGRWWPRWVEACAELFGDRVAGWFPIHDPVGVAARWTGDRRRHEEALMSVAAAWRDAWRILRGGPPVATSLMVRNIRAVDQTVPAAEAARLEDSLRWRMWLRALRDGVVELPNGVERHVAELGGATDLIGVATALDLPEQRVTDDSLRRWGERLGSIVRRAAEDGPDRPLVVSGLGIGWPQLSEHRLLVDASVSALAGAVADGVDLRTVYVSPAIGSSAGAHEHEAFVDRNREITGSTPAWQSLSN